MTAHRVLALLCVFVVLAGLFFFTPAATQSPERQTPERAPAGAHLTACADGLLRAEVAVFALPEVAPALGATAHQEAAIRRLAVRYLPAVVLVEDESAALHETLHAFAAHATPGEVAPLLEDLRTREHEREHLLRTLSAEMLAVLSPEQRLRWEALVGEADEGQLARTGGARLQPSPARPR